MTKRKTNPSTKAKEGGNLPREGGKGAVQYPQLPPAPKGTAWWQCPGTTQNRRDVSANPYRSIFATNRYDRSMWNDTEKSLPDGWGLEFRPKGEKGFYKTYYCPRGRTWASLVKAMQFVHDGCNYSALSQQKVRIEMHFTVLGRRCPSCRRWLSFAQPLPPLLPFALPPLHPLPLLCSHSPPPLCLPPKQPKMVRDPNLVQYTAPKINYRRFTNIDLGMFDNLPIEKMNEGNVDALYATVVEFLRQNPQKMEVIKEGESGGGEGRREAKRLIDRAAKLDIYGIWEVNFKNFQAEAMDGKFGKDREVGPQVEELARVWERRILRLGRKVTLKVRMDEKSTRIRKYVVANK